MSHAEIVGFELGRVENMVEKGENAGNKYFLLLAQCFQKLSTSELFRARPSIYSIENPCLEIELCGIRCENSILSNGLVISPTKQIKELFSIQLFPKDNF